MFLTNRSNTSNSKKRWLKTAACCLLIFLLGGCTSLAVNSILDPLTTSLQRQTDIELVAEGTPTLLLMVDGFIAENPTSEKLLLAGTQLYSSHTSIVYELGDVERAIVLSTKAKEYGISLLSLTPAMQKSLAKPLDEFSNSLRGLSKATVPSLFWGGYGWATWIQLQEGAPAALADLPKIEQIMLRVVELNESYHHGAAHAFLGYYYGFRPAMFGGNLEKSRFHFEKALQSADRNYLLTQVSCAESYARQAFDRELYKKLLEEVLAYPVKKDSDLASSNQFAKIRARKLLAQIDEYF